MENSKFYLIEDNNDYYLVFDKYNSFKTENIKIIDTIESPEDKFVKLVYKSFNICITTDEGKEKIKNVFHKYQLKLKNKSKM